MPAMAANSENAEIGTGSGAVAPDRRTRRRHERRNAVYQAAVELFIERGYDSTTMEDIADRADVARATVFNHFPRKTAFLDEWSSRRRQRAVQAVLAEHLAEHSASEILGRYMKELAKLSIETRQETVALMDAAVHSTNVLGNPQLAHELAKYVARGQRHGELRRSIDSAQAGLLLATGYFATLTHWIGAEPAPFDLDHELANMLELVLGGLLRADADAGSRRTAPGGPGRTPPWATAVSHS